MSATKRTSEVCGRIADELSSIAVLGAGEVAVETRRDQWPVAFKYADSSLPWSVVARPSTVGGVQAVLRWARESDTSLLVVGAGSNVIGSFDEPPAVMLSTECLNRIVSFDECSQLVTVQSGVNGQVLEDYLNESNLTIGQYPQSLPISSVGGWIAARASGSHSALYGGIESALRGVEVVMATGEVIRIEPRVRPPGGLDLLALLCGSEGSLGVVTEVSLEVHRRLGESTKCKLFNSLRDGLEAQRELVQGGYHPALVRLYNAAETATIISADLLAERGRECLLLVTVRAPDAIRDYEIEAIGALLEGKGGRPIPDDAAQSWFDRRYSVKRLMGDGNRPEGRIFDTIEVSAPWGSLADCAEALESEMPRLSDPFYQHFSHVYRAGACLYMMLHLEDDDDRTVLQKWAAAWERALRIVRRHGGTFGHHHGIGAIRSGLYGASPEGRIHADIKEALDRRSVLAGSAFNPRGGPESFVERWMSPR